MEDNWSDTVWEVCTHCSTLHRREQASFDIYVPFVLGVWLFLFDRWSVGSTTKKTTKAVLLCMAVQVVLPLVATLATFDVGLVLHVLVVRMAQMPMTQPQNSWVSEQGLRYWLVLAKGCIWQSTINWAVTLGTQISGDLRQRRPLMVLQNNAGRYATMCLHTVGSAALMVVLHNHELCRWSTWLLLSAIMRRVMMKPVMDPSLRQLLHLPACLGPAKFGPLIRVLELPFFLKVHQLVVVALDNSAGGAEEMMAMMPLVSMLVYSKLLLDLWTLGKHVFGTSLALLTRRAVTVPPCNLQQRAAPAGFSVARG